MYQLFRLFPEDDRSWSASLSYDDRLGGVRVADLRPIGLFCPVGALLWRSFGIVTSLPTPQLVAWAFLQRGWHDGGDASLVASMIDWSDEFFRDWDADGVTDLADAMGVSV